MEFFLRQVYPWMIDVSAASSLLPFIAGLFMLSKHKSRRFWLLFLYVILMVLNEAAGHLTVYLGTKNNLWIQHTFTPILFCVVAAVYYHSFRRAIIKRGIVVATIAFLLISVADVLLGEGIMQMNSVPHMVESSVLIAISLLYFYKVANDLDIIYLDRDPVFLMSCGLLIFKAGTSMSYAMFNAALAESYDAARMCIAIMLVLNILYKCSLIFVLKRAS